MFPWELAQAMAKAPIGYVPLGVLEWHGEHNAVGLDAIKAHAICVRAAGESGGVVVPPLYWGTDWREDLPDGTYLTGGVERGERYHVPGNMFWIRPETFHNLLRDIFEAMRRRGFRVVMIVAGHWSRRAYLPVLLESAAEFLSWYPEMKLAVVTDQEVGADLGYPHEHAAGGETSLLMAIRPDLVDLSKILETDRSLRSYYETEPEHLHRRRSTGNKYIGINPAVDDHSNDPESAASMERGERLLRIISHRIAERACSLLAQANDRSTG